jgi:hypothetical protein
MRNIAQYPLTGDEVVAALDHAGEWSIEKAPFGVVGYALHFVKQWLIDHPDTLAEIVESAKV